MKQLHHREEDNAYKLRGEFISNRLTVIKISKEFYYILTFHAEVKTIKVTVDMRYIVIYRWE